MNFLPISLLSRRTFSVRLVLAAVACVVICGHQHAVQGAPSETDGQVAAREIALEMAGAFTNDGYKIRDGHWTGQLKLKEPRILTVNLYAGNQYYFSLGSTDKAKKVNVTVYDEAGKQVGDELFFQDRFRAAAGVSPVASGPYYVSIQLLEGEPTDFCLLYSYK